MKNHRIAYVTAGHSEFDDDVREILSRQHPYQRCFTEFYHIDLADCFILAGADVKTTIHQAEDVHVEMFIDPEDKSVFLARLRKLISEKYASMRGTTGKRDKVG